MKPIKVSEATGAVLDWMVSLITNPEWDDEGRRFNTIDYVDTGDIDDEPYNPSIDWAQGGPIIERECITSGPWTTSPAIAYKGTDHGRRPFCHVGPTRLVAAMRCYVASKLGDTVEVPDEI